MGSNQNTKVAIIGGGCAAMTAAWELTKPEHQGKYQVTVYQLGWRLGGKGASGRGPAYRIEEHGLHMWLGFYENAFRLMRECYGELDRDPDSCRLATWKDAFVPHPAVGISELADGFPSEVWKVLVPIDDKEPGDVAANYSALGIDDYVVRVIDLLVALVQELPREAEQQDKSLDGVSPTYITSLIEKYWPIAETLTLTALWHVFSVLQLIAKDLKLYESREVVQLLNIASRNVLEQLRKISGHDRSAGRVWTLIDLTLATIRGIVSDGLLTATNGLDEISDYDCREWLEKHGAAKASTNSGYLRAMYSMVFAYEGGDPGRPRMDAGQAVRGIMRSLFTYRGSFFWRMQGGMGDVVFAPLYEALKRRGVRFEFFHRLTNVGLSKKNDGRQHVTSLDFEVQAQLLEDEYHPLIDVDGLPCWPSLPLYDQLEGGGEVQLDGRDYESFWDTQDAKSKKLKVSTDFDAVVLGIGLGAIPSVCGEIVARDAKWRDMVQNVKTVATQAFQLWLRVDLTEVGWQGHNYTVSGFANPFDTWADMSHLINEERWPTPPKAIGYFCNVMREADLDQVHAYPFSTQKQAHDELVKQAAMRYLDEEVENLWPEAANGASAFRWDLVADPYNAADQEATGDERFDTQFWTANTNPSDRYVQSLPGTAKYRISALDVSYSNLTIAGDWTDCGFNSGCVEAAVMSGLLASHAISGSPELDDIVGYDHP